jgi:hypothetical protein
MKLKFKTKLITYVMLLVVLISCENFKDIKIKAKNNIDSVEVVTTSGDTIIIFSGNYITIVPKRYR